MRRQGAPLNARFSLLRSEGRYQRKGTTAIPYEGLPLLALLVR